MRRIFLFLLSFGIVFLPVVVSAADLVPCNGPDCKACHVVSLAQNVLTWLIGIMALVIALVFAIGGFKMVMAGGDTGAVSSAREMMKNAIIGFVILLSAWLIINTLFLTFTNKGGIEVWGKIECTADIPRTVPPVVAPGVATPSGTPTAGCETCKVIPYSIPTNGNECPVNLRPCQMRPDMAKNLEGVNLGANGLRVSEAWPPTGYTEDKPRGIHAEACHGTATCVDVSFGQIKPSGQAVQNAVSNFGNNNLTAVYEVQTETRAQELRSQGVTSVLVVPTINREHFSVYMCGVDKTPRACGGG